MASWGRNDEITKNKRIGFKVNREMSKRKDKSRDQEKVTDRKRDRNDESSGSVNAENCTRGNENKGRTFASTPWQ